MREASWGAGGEQYNIMLDAVRRWFTWGAALPAWPELVAWARDNHWTLKRTIAHDGWAMDANPQHPGWRIEWGPAQRSFMTSRELRIRIEAPLLPDVQGLVLDRALLAQLDRQVYEQFTGSVQTRLDEDTPEEMRWLAMHAKLSPNQMGLLLRDRYAAIGTDREWLSTRLAGPLAAALKGRADARPIELAAAEPFMLRLARGQVVIRQASATPNVALLQSCLAIAAAADAALNRPN
jgi:hypothetical protein